MIQRAIGIAKISTETNKQMEKEFTRITIEQSDKKLVWEVPREELWPDDIMQPLEFMVAMINNERETFMDVLSENKQIEKLVTES